MNHHMRFITCMLALLCLFSSFFSYAKADIAVYPAYTYDAWDESRVTPQNFLPEAVVTGIDKEGGAWNNPQDLCVDTSGHIYLADTGNNRILIFDNQFNLLDTITEVYWQGQAFPISAPTGLHISKEGLLYIAQQEAMNALVIDIKQKSALLVLEKPDHELISADFIFRPSKITADRAGRIYVLSYGCFMGFLQFNSEGEFMGYYGSNKVELTPDLLLKYYWKQLMSDEQRESLTSILPVEYANLHYGADHFVYAATVGTTYALNQIKRLNPLGNNTYYGNNREQINFGDAEFAYTKIVFTTQAVNSTFTDVVVDNDGFIFGLDRQLGRIFERDQEGNLIAIFGGMGDQVGTFKVPTAIDLLDNKVLVLDSSLNNITIFQPTDYEQLLHQATVRYNDGFYDNALTLWRNVLKFNVNSTLAYLGIGRALMKADRVAESLYYFEMGSGRYEYSQAYRIVRLNSIRRHAVEYLSIASGFLVLMIVWHLWRKKHPKKEGHENYLHYSVRIVMQKLHLKTDNAAYRVLLHPFDGFARIRFGGADALTPSVIILLLMVIAFVYQYRETGFVFNYNKPEDMNFPLLLAKSLGVFISFCLAEWSMSILMNGIGRLRDIIISTTYVLIPYITAIFISTYLSKFLTMGEQYAQYFLIVGGIWSLMLLIVSTMVIHEFNFSNSLLFLLLCLACMAVMVFVMVLFYTLLQQLYSFLYTLVIEIIFRI